MEPLTNENRVRHAQAIRNATLTKVNMWPVRRIGTTRTADGAAFLMSDPRYVGKMLYYKFPDERDKIMEEYEIGRVLGAMGIAPKVHSYQDVDFDYHKLPVNLLSNKFTRKRKGIFIIMENLGYRSRSLETLSEYVKRTGKFPERQVDSLVRRMHSKGILHGDLHMGNIVIRTRTTGKIQVYLIDFGRSVRTGLANPNNYLAGATSDYRRKNANMLLKIKA